MDICVWTAKEVSLLAESKNSGIMLNMQLIENSDIIGAKEILDKGGILAVATETVYGLAVELDNFTAIQKLLRFKERDNKTGKILTLMLANTAEINKYAETNNVAKRIIKKHFPGELSLVLSKKKTFKHPYFDALDSVGIRIPRHELMLQLLEKTGPLLVSSANRRGKAPCMSSKDVLAQLEGIDGVIKGRAGGSPASTVLSCLLNEKMRILRQGKLVLDTSS